MRMRSKIKMFIATCGILTFALIGCGGDGGPIVEKVEETWPNGNNKKIIVYQGKPTNIVRTTMFFENGTIQSDRFFKGGNPDSVMTINYPSGQVNQQTFYKDGEKHGSEKSWYENGKLRSEAQFENGTPVGRHVTYFACGQIEQDITFKDGQRHEIMYFANGNKRRVRDFKGGRQEGVAREWFESGNLQGEHMWVDGAKNGPFTLYHDICQGRGRNAVCPDGGMRQMIGKYVSGQYHDTVLTFTRTGRREALAIYENGRRVYGASFAHN